MLKIELELLKAKAAAKRLASRKGEMAVSTLIKILITIVVGALLLTLIVGLINTLWPEITQKIIDLFGLGGSGAAASSATSA